MTDSPGSTRHGLSFAGEVRLVFLPLYEASYDHFLAKDAAAGTRVVSGEHAPGYMLLSTFRIDFAGTCRPPIR